MGVAVSSSLVFSAAPSSSRGGLLTLCACSSMSPSHGRRFFMTFSNASPSHRVRLFRDRLLQRGSPRGVTSPTSKPAPAWASALVHRSCQELAPAWAAQGVTASFRHIHLLWCGVLHGLQVAIFLPVDLRGLQGDSLPQHGLHHGLQGNLCSGTWSTSSSSFLTNLVVSRVVSLTYFHSTVVIVQHFFFPS